MEHERDDGVRSPWQREGRGPCLVVFRENGESPLETTECRSTPVTSESYRVITAQGQQVRSAASRLSFPTACVNEGSPEGDNFSVCCGVTGKDRLCRRLPLLFT